MFHFFLNKNADWPEFPKNPKLTTANHPSEDKENPLTVLVTKLGLGFVDVALLCPVANS